MTTLDEYSLGLTAGVTGRLQAAWGGPESPAPRAATTSAYAPTHHSGWYFAGWVSELTAPITPLRIGRARLMLVRHGDGVQAYHSTCPHRGADLAYGGELVRAGVKCPFHGKTVSLGERDGCRYSVPDVPQVRVGDALFCGLDADILEDHGFATRMAELGAEFEFFACPEILVPITQEMVIENAFDLDHFREVHLVPRVLAVDSGKTHEGAVFGEAMFEVGKPPWMVGPKRMIRSRFRAVAYSPSVVVTEMGPPGDDQAVITTATADADGCRVRVLIGVRPGVDGVVRPEMVESLVKNPEGLCCRTSRCGRTWILTWYRLSTHGTRQCRCSRPSAPSSARWVDVADQPPVVTWLHGYTMDSRIWSPVWSLLPEFQHVGLDLPGHGRGPALTPSASIDEWAELVEEDMLAHGSRLLVALCMGTMVATQVLLRGRLSLDGIVLVAPALVGMEEDRSTVNRFGSLVVKARRGAGRDELARVWMQPPSAIFSGMTRFPERLAALRAVIAEHSWPGLSGGGPMAFRGEPQTIDQVVEAVGACPLLLVSGGHDMRSQRDTARALAGRIPGALLVDLPDLGHLPVLEDPSAVIPAMRAFLTGAGHPAVGHPAERQAVGVVSSRVVNSRHRTDVRKSASTRAPNSTAATGTRSSGPWNSSP